MRRLDLFTLITVLAMGACARRVQRDGAPPPLPATARDAGVTSVARATVAVDGSVPRVSDAAVSSPEPVDLLRATEATVTVSSAVDNANDRPDRLFDGDLATAWSSRTGEMERTWVEVRLPDDARVSHIELTAGYTRQTERQDLFTANVRIRRVRVSHGGQRVGEFDLDPEQRGLQRVNTAGGGGVWRVEMIGLMPGTRSAWREVTVSELRVMGTPGAARRSAEQPPAVQVVGAATSPVAAANGSLEVAIGELMHDVAQEGVSPGEGDLGCSGLYAERCVRGAWANVASSTASVVRARCPTGIDAPTRAADRLWSRYERKAERERRRDEPDEALEHAAAEAFDAYVESLGAMIAACPAAANLERVHRAIAERDPLPLRRFRP
jgi:hypothetical protein